MKKQILLTLIVLAASCCYAMQTKTYEFAEKEGQILKMDVYFPNDDSDSHPCIMFYFGGGFISGARNDSTIVKFCESMAYDYGFVAIAADYRLGLKDVENIGIFNKKPIINAIDIAAQDAISAIAFVLDHHKELKINPNEIIIGGSSAGAITSLQSNYYLSNGLGNSYLLPEDFRLAGVVSFAGAVFSANGKVKYKNFNPAPTMFFHGMKDHLVEYEQIRIFNKGLFGSDALVEQFEKEDYPYFIRRYENYAHAVAGFYNLEAHEVAWFYKNYIVDGKEMQIDEKINFVNNAPKVIRDISRPSDIYK